MWLSSKTERERERETSDCISSLSICINHPLFDACGQQPSANRRTEVKLQKKRTIFFQKKKIHQKSIITIQRTHMHTNISTLNNCSSEEGKIRDKETASWRFVLADIKLTMQGGFFFLLFCGTESKVFSSKL